MTHAIKPTHENTHAMTPNAHAENKPAVANKMTSWDPKNVFLVDREGGRLGCEELRNVWELQQGSCVK